MFCPRCKNNNCHPINEVTTQGKDFSASKGCCGWFLFGPIGLLCGLCGEGKTYKNTNYWICNNCGLKFKNESAN